ncbi:MAG: helicase [Oleibacter sp.]|nr:helicase [Thalassolituus sp.]
MKFRLMLWLLAVLMKRAARKNSDFRDRLAEEDVTFQIQTNDMSVVRSFSICAGKVTSHGHSIANPTFTIGFVDAATATNIISSQDGNAFMSGIQNKTITVQGDLSKVLWFQGLIKHLK